MEIRFRDIAADRIKSDLVAIPVREKRLDDPAIRLLDRRLKGQLRARMSAMQVQVIEPGQWIFREGDAGDAWYVVYDGEVEVVKRPGDRVIAVLGTRACFGEMAILDGSPRSASVRSTGPTTVFRFPRTSFTRLISDGNLAAYKLVHQMALVLVSRQRRTTSRLADALAGSADAHVLRDALLPIADQSSVAE